MFAFFNGVDERGQINYFDQAPVPHMRMEDEALEATILFLDSLRNNKESEVLKSQNQFRENFQEWIQQDFQSTDIDQQLSVGLLAHFKMDEFNNLTTPNEKTGGHQGQANVKIISELSEPEMISGWNGRAMKFDGKNYLSLGDVGDGKK